jgi:glutamyl-tRNA synthetase
MSSIYANNRELIDDDTDRAFFVRNGVEKQVVGGPDRGEPPVHPDHPDRGTRQIQVSRGVVVEPDDVPANGQRIWLKGYGCVRHTRDAFEYTGDDIEVVRDGDVDVVHWAPADGPQLRLRTMDGDVEGTAEPCVGEYADETMLQFERIGFARLDRCEDDRIVAYFAHP